jgi:DNA primase large subunit
MKKDVDDCECSYTPTYECVPNAELSFEEILSFAEKRYQFHRLLEFEEKHETVEYSRIRTLSIEYDVPIKASSINKNDQILDEQSFYSLFLVCSRDEKEKEFFARCEARLLYYRLKLSYAPIKSIPEFFWLDREKRKLIINSRTGTEEYAFPVPFEEVIDEVKYPETLEIQAGMAVLSCEQVYQILQGYFEKIVLGYFERRKTTDSRFVEYLVSEFLRETNDNDIEKILTLENYEELCKRSAPPCIYRIIESLNKSSQLSVKGRFELCMFFKFLGLDYFSQYIYWKTHFFNPRNPDMFEKQIVPSLRYIYCIDGNKKRYQPHSCLALIGQDNPETPYQIQGCPFRYMMRAELKMYLKKMARSVKNDVINSLVEQVPEHPQIACKMFFDGCFPDRNLNYAGVSHPIQYFKESEARINNKHAPF